MIVINTMFKNNSRGQIWIETVVYTLIGLTIMAILLTIAVPQIEKIKDKGVMSQTVDALNILNSKILEAEESQGNIRIANLKITKGNLEINSNENKIIYSLENTRLEPTEIGETVKEGDITIETKKSGDKFNVLLTIDYNSTLNITYAGEKKTKILQAGTSPYKIIIENTGYDSLRRTKIDHNVD